jgi:hypothetical protein
MFLVEEAAWGIERKSEADDEGRSLARKADVALEKAGRAKK